MADRAGHVEAGPSAGEELRVDRHGQERDGPCRPGRGRSSPPPGASLPYGTVPSGGGRIPRPSAQNPFAWYAFTFCCRCIGSRRGQPASGEPQDRQDEEAGPHGVPSSGTIETLAGAEPAQVRGDRVRLGPPHRRRQPQAVDARGPERLHLEDRVVDPREAEVGEEQAEEDGERRRRARPSSKVTGMNAGGLCGGRFPTLRGQSTPHGPPLEDVAGDGAGDARDEGDEGHGRPPEPERLLRAVERVRRVEVEASRRPSPAAPGRRRGGPPRSANSPRTQLVMRPPRRAAACVVRPRARARWRSSFTSEIGIAGMKRRKRRNSTPKVAIEPKQQPPVDPGRRVVGPGRREEVAGERDGDDDEPLRPHPDVHEDRDEEEDEDVGARPRDPEDLRRHHVAEDLHGVDEARTARPPRLKNANHSFGLPEYQAMKYSMT